MPQLNALDLLNPTLWMLVRAHYQRWQLQRFPAPYVRQHAVASNYRRLQCPIHLL